jgi:hypothetical protein
MRALAQRGFVEGGAFLFPGGAERSDAGVTDLAVRTSFQAGVLIQFAGGLTCAPIRTIRSRPALRRR